MKTNQEKIDTIIEEAKILKEKIEDALKKNAEVNKLYIGTRIFFSNLIIKPVIYLIGINPGGGYEGDELTTLETLEYIDNKRNKYALARETVNVFEGIGRLDLLINSTFKTNIFFTSTQKQTHFYKITDFLGRAENELGSEVFKSAYKWTKELIDIIQPRIIICEGKGALIDLCNSLDLDEHEFKWKNDCTKLNKNNKTIIAYNRFYSNIKNKTELANLIESSLSELNL